LLNAVSQDTDVGRIVNEERAGWMEEPAAEVEEWIAQSEWFFTYALLTGTH